MWNVIEKAAEHVNVYSTVTGQAWYLIVFVFRLIVVATIGGSVYGDEQSAFRCSTKVTGCDNVCYDKFAKISHIRFWAFQLLALTSPVVVFHFYTIFMNGKIEKLKEAEEEAENERRRQEENENVEQENGKANENSTDKWKTAISGVNKQLEKRRKSVGKMKKRKVFNKEKLEKITITRGIRLAYLISVFVRVIIEIIFLFLAFDMFRFAEYEKSPLGGGIVSDGRRVDNPLDLFWIRVPQLYRCGGDSVRWACFQHLLPGSEDSYVPCWVSRPWEKTIFLRYMNTLSIICLLLAVSELVQLSVRFIRKYNKRGKEERRDELFPYERPPSNNYLPPEAVKPPANDAYYNKNELKPIEETKVPPSQPTVSFKPSKSASSNAFVDLASGKVTVEELRNLLKEQPKQPRRTESRSTTELKRLREEREPTEKTSPSESKTKRVSKTRFQIPYGTQSLNRPRKLNKAGYSSLYRLGSISFSHSEEEGGSGGGEDSTSGEETERESVSVHSAHSDDFV